MKQKIIKDFAFDFWLNTKYNYRSIDYKVNETTLANEHQMDKALKKMEG